MKYGGEVLVICDQREISTVIVVVKHPNSPYSYQLTLHRLSECHLFSSVERTSCERDWFL